MEYGRGNHWRVRNQENQSDYYEEIEPENHNEKIDEQENEITENLMPNLERIGNGDFEIVPMEVIIVIPKEQLDQFEGRTKPKGGGNA